METMKYIKNTIVMAMMGIIAMTFTSCGGDEDSDTGNYSVVGTWQITEIPEGDESDMKVGDTIILTEDGMIYDKWSELGTWKKGGQCYLTDSEAYPVPFTAKVLSLTENYMSVDITIYEMTFNIKFKRVA